MSERRKVLGEGANVVPMLLLTFFRAGSLTSVLLHRPVKSKLFFRFCG